MGGQVTGQHSSTTYSLGCGKTTSTVEGYLLGCNKTTETLEAYQTGCGLSDGQIVGAMIVYDQSAIQTMANMSMPRPVAEPMSLPVMENDSNNSIPEMVPEDENANEEQETVVSEEVNNIPEEIPEEVTIVEEAPLEDVETQEPPEVTPESELPNVEEPTTDIEPEETFSEEAVEEITENNTEGGDG